MSDQRGRLLLAALGFAGLPRPSYDRALWALRFWLDPWSGVGRVVVGMARQGYDVQLTRTRLARDLLHDRDGALDHELQIGDRLADETGEWEVASRPYTTNAGKNAHVRVRRVDQPDAPRRSSGVPTSA